MNMQRLIAIAAAIATNAGVLACFHVWSAAQVANATPTRPQVIATLPVMHVWPSAAQLREVHNAAAARAAWHGGTPGKAQTLAGRGA